jgi:hypothetical protein
MGSILLPRHYRGARARYCGNIARSRLVMLAAATAPVFLAAGALAQAQETSSPVLSSGLDKTTTLQTSVIARPSQRPKPNLSPIRRVYRRADRLERHPISGLFWNPVCLRIWRV